MMSKGRLAFTLASFTVVLLMLLGTMTAAANRQQADTGSDSLYKNLSVFMEVFGLVNKAYVDKPESELLMGGALEGALDALDPFSQYIPASDVERFRSVVLPVGHSRSGVMILKEQGVAYAVAVDEGSPADEADLAPGDILSTIDGRSTREMSLHRIQELMAGPKGTMLKVERLRQGSKTIVELTLNEYPHAGVELSVHKGLPVLRIPSFHDKVKADVEASLQAVRKEGPFPDLEDPGKLVIDVRGVAGGDTESAYQVAGLFAQGDLGKLLGRSGELRVFSAADAPSWSGKLVVLVDRGTQGAAEVLSAVLKQQLDAVLVGEETFGHSGLQESVSLSNGGQVLLTRAFYTGPDGEALDSGQVADVRVRSFSGSSPEPTAEEPVDDDSVVGEPANDNSADTAGDDGKAEASVTDPVLERGVDFLLNDETLEEEQAEAA